MLKTNQFMQEYKHNVTSSLLRQTLHEACYKKKNPSLKSDLLHARTVKLTFSYLISDRENLFVFIFILVK